MGEETPEKVLSRIYANLENLKVRGDPLAISTLERLRLIVSFFFDTKINCKLKFHFNVFLFSIILEVFSISVVAAIAIGHDCELQLLGANYR